jgi:tetratricopeptide (TPR) repeat protein
MRFQTSKLTCRAIQKKRSGVGAAHRRPGGHGPPLPVSSLIKNRSARVTLTCACVQLAALYSVSAQSFAVLAAENTPAKEVNAAHALIKEHRYTQADALLSTLEKAYPTDPELPMVRGNLLREIGQVDRAIHEFARAAELAPSDPFPLIALADLSLKQMELEQSLTYAQQAVASDPSCLPARVELVDVLLQCGQTAEAERQLKCIPEESKQDPSVEQLAYRLSLKKGDLSSARSHLKKTMIGSNKNKGSLNLRLEESDLLETMGDNKAARSELEKIIQDDPDSLSARLRLARLLEKQYHDYSAALVNYKEALRIDPLSAQAIAGNERCLLKRRNIALQLKMALREFWSKFTGEDAASTGSSPSH